MCLLFVFLVNAHPTLFGDVDKCFQRMCDMCCGFWRFQVDGLIVLLYLYRCWAQAPAPELFTEWPAEQEKGMEKFATV